MYVINAKNVNYALQAALQQLVASGMNAPSRNGPVRFLPVPCTTVYERPWQRVLFSQVRDANPFFHLFEALWMLAGSNQLAPLTHYVKRFSEFSDDGETLHGAYGYRWRNHFDTDQLETVIDMLERDKTTRRVVLAMWDPVADLGRNAKDIPCNTQVYFSAATGALDMTVLCRSNDAVWGAYGANAVHFSLLQEFIAGAVKIPVGRMWQMSNNLHVYSERPDVARLYEHIVNGGSLCEDFYDTKLVRSIGMYEGVQRMTGRAYLDFIDEFVADPQGFQGDVPFLSFVAKPLAVAHQRYKDGDFDGAMSALNIVTNDWHFAGRRWLQLRKKGKETSREDVR